MLIDVDETILPSLHHTLITALAMFRDRFTCQVCGFIGVPGVGAGYIQVHHILAKSEGGLTVIENLRTLCTGCHPKTERRIRLRCARLNRLQIVRLQKAGAFDPEKSEEEKVRIRREIYDSIRALRERARKVIRSGH